MISSECSSHFMEAYSEYQKGKWIQDQAPKNSIVRSKNTSASDHWQRCAELQRQAINPNQSGTDVVLDDVINKLTHIPLVKIQIDDGDESSEGIDDEDYKSVDAFTNETMKDDNLDHSVMNDDVPSLWKKDVRDRRRSINSAFLSPVHLNNLNRQHRRASINPESFDGLRQISIELQDKRNLQSSASVDSDCNEEDHRGSDEEINSSSLTNNDINTSRISQKSNVLLQRSRRLSVDSISIIPKPPADLQPNKTRKLSLMPKMSSYSTLPKIDNKFLVNKTQKYKNNHKLDVHTMKTSTLAAPLDIRKERRASVNMLQTAQLRNRRLSLPHEDNEMRVEVTKRRTSVMYESNIRRASRIISKFEQNIIQKEIALTGGKAEEEDPLKELKACRYLRQNYKAEEPDTCPCHNCEKRKSPECLSSSHGSGTLCLTSS